MRSLIATICAMSFVLIPNQANATEIEESGTCSADSRWQADLELEYKVFDLGFEIDTRKSDEAWTFTLRHNGKRVASEILSTNKDFDDSYAEVEWDVIRPDRRGIDTFVFRAVNQVTGEVCKSSLRA